MNRRNNRLSPALRHGARALVLALCGVVIASIAAGPASTVSATSRVAVSDEVKWPFYASAREQLVQIAQDPAVRSAVIETLGTTSVELSAAPTDGEIVVELTAEAESPAVAVAAANLLADQLVAAGADRAQAERSERVQDLEQSIAAADDRLQANDAELARLGTAIDALGEDPPQAEQVVLQSQVQQLESAQREDARLRAAQVQALVDARLAVERAESDFTVIGRADDVDQGLLGDPTTVALLAGIPLLLIGLGASVLWDQTFGLVRRPADIRWVSQLPVAVLTYRGDLDDPEFVDANSLKRRLRRHQIPGSRWLLVPLGDGAHRLAQPLAHLVDDDEHLGNENRGTGASRTATDADEDRDDERRFPSPGDTRLHARTVERRPRSRALVGPLASLDESEAASVSAAALVVVRRRVRISTLRSAISDLAVEGLPLEAIVLLDHQKR